MSILLCILSSSTNNPLSPNVTLIGLEAVSPLYLAYVNVLSSYIAFSDKFKCLYCNPLYAALLLNL